MEQVVAIPDHITYGATRDGRIICLRTEKEVKQCEDASGYKWVWLTNKDGTNHYLVSRLIAATFIPRTDVTKNEVDHIDRNRGNNNVSNLRWADDYDQSINRIGWGKYKKFISMENYGTYACWSIQIRNRNCKLKRRFDCSKYTLDDVITIRNDILTQHQIPITD
jgi:hypothetical protein